MPTATLETLDVSGVQALLERAGEEGWNPGVGDACAFHRADPEGFLVRRIDGRFVAGISVVRQDDAHAFLGLYIADPQYRGQGHGLALWNAALARFDGISVGLDGVLQQQANYARSGFELLHRNLRWSGSVEHWPVADAGPLSLRAPGPADRERLVALDAEVGGVPRPRFIDAWCLHGEADARHSLLVERKGRTVGLGTIRRCAGPHKLGPLIAPDADVAQALLGALVDRTAARQITIDVPEPNRAALAWVKRLGMAPVFETARMYRGAVPVIDTSRLFGVATLELG